MAPACAFPFPTPGLPVRPVHPFSIGTMGGLRLPVAPLFGLRFLRPPIPWRRRSFFVCCLATSRGHSTLVPAGQELFDGSPYPFLFQPWKQSGSPRFLGSLHFRSATLLDPGRAFLPGLFSSSVRPPIRRRRRPLRLTRFRGSLTWLPGSLSTLPRLRYLRRARLASGWWPAFTGWAFFTHKAPLESFRSAMSTHVIPSSFSRLILARYRCVLRDREWWRCSGGSTTPAVWLHAQTVPVVLRPSQIPREAS